MPIIHIAISFFPGDLIYIHLKVFSSDSMHFHFRFRELPFYQKETTQNTKLVKVPFKIENMANGVIAKSQ